MNNKYFINKYIFDIKKNIYIIIILIIIIIIIIKRKKKYYIFLIGLVTLKSSVIFFNGVEYISL